MFLSYKQREADLVSHRSPEEELVYRAEQIMNTVRVHLSIYQNDIIGHTCGSNFTTGTFHVHCRWMESMKIVLQTLVPSLN